jgi:hypothetical protein
MTGSAHICLNLHGGFGAVPGRVSRSCFEGGLLMKGCLLTLLCNCSVVVVQAQNGAKQWLRSNTTYKALGLSVLAFFRLVGRCVVDGWKGAGPSGTKLTARARVFSRVRAGGVPASGEAANVVHVRTRTKREECITWVFTGCCLIWRTLRRSASIARRTNFYARGSGMRAAGRKGWTVSKGDYVEGPKNPVYRRRFSTLLDEWDLRLMAKEETRSKLDHEDRAFETLEAGGILCWLADGTTLHGFSRKAKRRKFRRP